MSASLPNSYGAGSQVSPDRELFHASASLGSADGRWKVTAFGKNVGNNASEGGATDVGFWVVTVGYVPCAYGVELVYQSEA